MRFRVLCTSKSRNMNPRGSAYAGRPGKPKSHSFGGRSAGASKKSLASRIGVAPCFLRPFANGPTETCPKCRNEFTPTQNQRRRIKSGLETWCITCFKADINARKPRVLSLSRTINELVAQGAMPVQLSSKGNSPNAHFHAVPWTAVKPQLPNSFRTQEAVPAEAAIPHATAGKVLPVLRSIDRVQEQPAQCALGLDLKAEEARAPLSTEANKPVASLLSQHKAARWLKLNATPRHCSERPVISNRPGDMGYDLLNTSPLTPGCINSSAEGITPLQ